MTKPKTQTQFILWLESYIDDLYFGNQSLAAVSMNEDRTVLNAVLNGHRKPTKRILEAVGYERKVTYKYQPVED